LRDDIFVSESVWYDRKDVLNFYIRRLTIDQDTQTPIIAWYDKDGNSVEPDVSLLIQANATSELQTEIINQISAINAIAQQIQANQQNQLVGQITQAQVANAIQSAADIDTLIARLTSIDTKTLLQSDIVSAIQSAADIDTLIARLTSIDNKTVAAVPTTKTTIVGFTTVSNLGNNNLLDPTGAGGWTDVRAFQSCELTYSAGGTATFFFGGMQSAFDSIGSGANAARLVTAFSPSNGAVDTTTSVTPLGSVKLKYDLTGVAFIRVQAAPPLTGGHRVTGVFSPFATTNRVLAQIAGTVPVSATSPIITTDLFGVITTTQNNSSIEINPGQSYQVNIEVNSITGVLAQSIVTLQEQSTIAGTTWRTVYAFEPITLAKGVRVYKSPVLTATGSRYRIIETVTGTTPSINRTISRTTIAATGLVNQDTRSQTIYNANLASIDVPAYGVIRAINALTTLATPLWIQLHDSIAPVAPGAQPRVSIRIPVDGLSLGSAYFGEGRLWGGLLNPRIAISTSANGYTQISLAANTVQLFIEAI
jgi:hypothetical protein